MTTPLFQENHSSTGADPGSPSINSAGMSSIKEGENKKDSPMDDLEVRRRPKRRSYLEEQKKLEELAKQSEIELAERRAKRAQARQKRLEALQGIKGEDNASSHSSSEPASSSSLQARQVSATPEIPENSKETALDTPGSVSEEPTTRHVPREIVPDLTEVSDATQIMINFEIEQLKDKQEDLLEDIAELNCENRALKDELAATKADVARITSEKDAQIAELEEKLLQFRSLNDITQL